MRNRQNINGVKYICIYLLLFVLSLSVLSSCGYSIVGSKYLSFDSVTISPVLNKTYEPLLEESLHNALVNEFIAQGVDIETTGGDIDIEAVITNFELRAVGAVNDRVKEQMIVMNVDARIIYDGKVTEFKAMRSPIEITFQSEGSVTEAVAYKEIAIDKASAEIAREIVSKIILKYAK